MSAEARSFNCPLQAPFNAVSYDIIGDGDSVLFFAVDVSTGVIRLQQSILFRDELTYSVSVCCLPLVIACSVLQLLSDFCAVLRFVVVEGEASMAQMRTGTLKNTETEFSWLVS